MFSVQMTTESPVQVEPLKTPVSAKKHRRKLFLSNEKTNDENKAQKSLNESFEGNITHTFFLTLKGQNIILALETGKILTPSPLAMRRGQHGPLNKVRRQLRLSESEK